MSHRVEEKEARRQARLEHERQEARRQRRAKTLRAVGAAFALLLVVVGVVVAAGQSAKSESRATRGALNNGAAPDFAALDVVSGMLREGRHFAKLADNIVVKVPMSETGLEAMSRFKAEGIKTNCTLIFTANQGLLAAKAGASLLSPFVGRVDDINEDGMTVIRELAEIIRFYEFDSEVLTASVRHPRHVTEAAIAGSHIATLPFKVFQQMVHHPLTDKGIVQFKRDWEAARAAADESAKKEPAKVG
jgi:transaldolase